MRNFPAGIYGSLWRELSRIAHDGVYISILVALPIAAFVFFALFFQKGVADNMPIAVVDNDHSSLSRRLVSMIDATAAAEVRYGAESIRQAEKMVLSGEVYAVVVIPDGFEKSILGGGQSHAELYNSGTNISANSLLAKDIQTAVATFSTGVQLQLLQSRGLSAAQAMALAQPVRFTRHALFNPYINYAYYIAPCFMAMIVMIFTVLATIYALGTELKYSTAGEWLASGRGSLAAAVAGKLLPTNIAMSAGALVMYLIIFDIIGAPLNGSGWMLALSTMAFISAYQCVGVFLVAVTDNMRLALSLGGGYSVLAFTFSGLTFPTMAMAAPLQWLSHLFPFTFFMRTYIDQAMRGAPVAVSLPDVACMLLFCLLPVLTARRLRKITTNPAYWGKS